MNGQLVIGVTEHLKEFIGAKINLKDFSFLQGAVNIKKIRASNNQLEYLDNLADFKQLTEIDLSSNNIKNVNALTKLKHLVSLDISLNPLNAKDCAQIYQIKEVKLPRSCFKWINEGRVIWSDRSPTTLIQAD